jgi:predicted dehydrogenase
MTTRREFLRNAALASAGLAIGGVSTKTSAASYNRIVGANKKINIAHIGIGNRGRQVVQSFDRTGLANVVALCDVDMGAEHTQEVMAMYPNAKQFKDFRQMFDQISREFDAVSISTPDFAHFPATMMAMAFGKHVFVEKPLARTFYEVDLMEKAAKKYPNVVTQMCNQGHSGGNYHQFKAWKEAGIIKDVTAITAHMNSRRRWHGWDPNIYRFPVGEPVPETLDWFTWLSAQSFHEYNKDFVNGQWRCWYDFGMGALGDWGAHLIDTAHRFLELGMPEEVNPLLLVGHNDYFFPFSSTIEFKFPRRGDMPPVNLTWYDGRDNFPPLPEGYESGATDDPDTDIPLASDGTSAQQTSSLSPGKIIYSRELTFRGGSHSSMLSIIPAEKAKELERSGRLPELPRNQSGHFQNFLLACQGLEETRSPFEISGPLSKVFCLGVAAQRLGRKIKFDRATERVIGDPIADAFLVGPPPRRGWEDFYIV